MLLSTSLKIYVKFQKMSLQTKIAQKNSIWALHAYTRKAKANIIEEIVLYDALNLGEQSGDAALAQHEAKVIFL
jgi:hypothetical protein